MSVSQNQTLKISAPGSYNLIKTGEGPDNTVYVYGTLGGAVVEIQGPGGLIEDGTVDTLPWQKVIHHGGIAIQLVVTGGSPVLNVRVG